MPRIAALLAALMAMVHAGGAWGAGPADFRTLRDFSSVRAAGMAGAARGNAVGNEALLLNPASMVTVPRMNLAVTYQTDLRDDTTFWGIDSIDSSSLMGGEDAAEFAGGLGYYRYASGTGAQRRSGSLYAAGVAYSVTQLLCLGATAKFFDLDGAARVKGVTGDFAALLRLSSKLTLSGVGYNLVGVQTEETQRAFAGGMAVALGDLLADFDVRFEKGLAKQYVRSYAVGAEYLIGRLIAPRAGFQWDGLRERPQLGLGMSLATEVVAIEAAWRMDLGGRGRELSVALRFWNF